MIFAVFGMTRSYAESVARKKVATHIKLVPKTIDQYERDIDDFIDELMNSKKVAQVSQKFSTPELANQFLVMAAAQGGLRLQVKINHPWDFVIKNGVKKEKRKWSVYVEGKDYSLK